MTDPRYCLPRKPGPLHGATSRLCEEIRRRDAEAALRELTEFSGETADEYYSDAESLIDDDDQTAEQQRAELDSHWDWIARLCGEVREAIERGDWLTAETELDRIRFIRNDADVATVYRWHRHGELPPPENPKKGKRAPRAAAR